MKEYAVIGHPIAHTMSPFINKRLFSLSGKEAEYKVIDIAPENIENEINALKELSGFNVTIPDKNAIIPFLNATDETALVCSAANCVKVSGGYLYGYSTDAYGFMKSLEINNIPIPKTALLLGFGGAGRTVGVALTKSGTAVTVAVRPASIPKVQSEISKLNADKNCFSVCDIYNVKGSYDLLINATPVGMYPYEDASPVGDETVRLCDTVFDLVYNPTETKLIRIAAALGKRTVGGIGMLVLQAAKSHEIWYGASFSEKDILTLIKDAEQEVGKIFNNNIVLIGFMGSGKTSVGKVLAKKLGSDFSDTDEIIEKNYGCTVSEIFKRYGEKEFRKAEAKAIASLKGKRNTVIATGGGAVISPENVRVLKSIGTVVFLDADVKAIKKRLKDDVTRPLFSGETAKSLLNQRKTLYTAAADVTVSADGSIGTVSDEILKKTEEQKCKR